MNTQVIAISFNAIFPLFVIMGLGLYLKTINFLAQKTVAEMNKLVFNILLPLYSFSSIYKSKLREGVEWSTISFILIAVSIIFFTAWFICTKNGTERGDIATIVQGIYKCNYAIIGFPIATYIFGNDIGTVAILLPFIQLMNNIYAVYIFEHYRNSGNRSLLTILVKMAKNPLILGTLAGVVFNVFDIPLPDSLFNGVIKSLGSSCTPISMLALGASFDFSKVKQYKKLLTKIVLIRQVLIPIVVIPIAVLFGIRGRGLGAVVLVAASSTAVNSYPTAVAMGGNGDLANEIVVLTSVACMASLFLSFCAVGMTVGF